MAPLASSAVAALALTPFRLPPTQGDLNEVKRRVLRDKVDPSTKQRDGTTPLHHAAAVVHVDVVEWLVSQGANPAAKDARGRTPADAARAGGAANPAHPRHPRYHLTLKSLEGKSLFRASKDGTTLCAPSSLRMRLTPRRRCAGDLVRMQYLLESGASPNEANPRGVTPLHLAVSHEQLDAITLLLDHGADPRTKNSVGKSALDVAADHGKLGRRTLTLVRGARRAGKRHAPKSPTHPPTHPLPFPIAVGSCGGRSSTWTAPRRRRSRRRRRRRRTACWRRSRTRRACGPRRSCGR